MTVRWSTGAWTSRSSSTGVGSTLSQPVHVRVSTTPDPFLSPLTLIFSPRAPGAYPTTGHRRDPDLWPGLGSRLYGMSPGHRSHDHRQTNAQYPQVQKPPESVGKGRKSWRAGGRGAEGKETEEAGGDRKAGVWRSGRANVNGLCHLDFVTLGNVSSEKPLRDDSWRTSGSFCRLSSAYYSVDL